MYLKTLLRPLLAIFLFLSTASAIANPTLDKAKATLAQHETSLNNLGTKIRTMEGRIKSYGPKIEKAETAYQEAEANLANARRELIQAEHDKSEDGPRRADIAKRSFNLAEIALQSKEKRLTRLIKKREALEKEREKLLADSRFLQQEIRDQSERVLQLTTQAGRERKKKELAQTDKPKPVVVVTPTPQPTPTEELKPEIEVVEEEVVDSETSESDNSQEPAVVEGEHEDAPEESVASTEKKSQEDLSPAEARKQRYAIYQMEQANKKASENPDAAEWNLYKGIELNINRQDPVEFEYLGGHQYYAEAEIQKGKKTFKIRHRQYRINLRESGNYVVIYDTTDKKKPNFAIFNKKWID